MVFLSSLSLSGVGEQLRFSDWMILRVPALKPIVRESDTSDTHLEYINYSMASRPGLPITVYTLSLRANNEDNIIVESMCRWTFSRERERKWKSSVAG